MAYKKDRLTVQELYAWAVKERRENLPIYICSYGSVGSDIITMASDMVHIETHLNSAETIDGEIEVVTLMGDMCEIYSDTIEYEDAETDAILNRKDKIWN